MTKKSGLGQRFYVGGYAIHGDVGSFQRIAGGPAVLVVTGVDKLAFERITGKRDGGIDFTTFFNDAAGQEHAALKGLPTADVVCSLLTAATIGAPACSEIAKQIGYDGTRDDEGNLTFSIETQSNGYGVDWGEALTDGQRTDGAATDGSSWDYTAVQSSTDGWQMFWHLIAFTGTSVTMKVQDSANNSAFTDVTGATSGAQTVAHTAGRVAGGAGSTAVRRYVRVSTTGTFSNAVFVVAFTRNDGPVAF